MAGDWIKMRVDLHEDPSVIQMAQRLGVREEVVVGYCHKFWSWVSRQCNAASVTGLTLDAVERVISLPGFLNLMVDVGWLLYDDLDGIPRITIPNYERHLSQSAKKRALTNERVRNARVPELKRSDRYKSVTREEKRRVYKKTPYSPPEGDVLFEEFWSVFPRLRRTKKHKAAEAWRNAIKRGGDPQVIISAAREYADSPVGRGKFVQGPAPWLNGSCWEDDRLAWQRNDNGDVRREISTAELLGIEVTDDQP